jgi:hypothetical protein
VIRKTIVGYAPSEQSPHVESLLDADVVVFAGCNGPGRGRWSMAEALRLPAGDSASIEPISRRADGLAVVAGPDHRATLREVESMPDPVVVVFLLDDQGKTRAALAQRSDALRFVVIRADDLTRRVELTPATESFPIRVRVASLPLAPPAAVAAGPDAGPVVDPPSTTEEPPARPGGPREATGPVGAAPRRPARARPTERSVDPDSTGDP